MDPIITDYLSTFKFGALQTFKNISILPLFAPNGDGPEYVTLKEALDQNLITITEVDQHGSVPEVKVINNSGQSVLLLDGEELMGAKQNRVLNTSILLEQKSETVIPVSCTEQGRWGYTSPAFAHSDTMMSSGSRSAKLHSVSDSLQEARGYSSDQSRVWADIRRMHTRAGTASPTSAMRDLYAAKTQELTEYLAAFECMPHQQGCLVFIDGKVVGFDVISRETAYRSIHSQLVKSYAMDALLSGDETDGPSVEKAEAFLKAAAECQESRFQSVGQGYDYRFKGPKMIGSALVLEKSVIHMAFFKAQEENKAYFMVGFQQRRQFRSDQ